MSCAGVVGLAAFIPVLYLLCLYAFDLKGTNRNSPKSIKRRMIGVSLCCVVSIALTVWLLNSENFPTKEQGLIRFLGVGSDGFLEASLFPLLITIIFFFGPVIQMWFDGTLLEICRLCNVSDLKWIRNCIVAPLTEEIAFRVCTASLLRLCWSEGTVIGLAPIFFSLAHYHHMIDMRRRHIDWTRAFSISTFQVAYTYIFGSYATFLFLRTGHVVAPLFSHMFCNLLGFPPVMDIFDYSRSCKQKSFLICCYVLGFLAWSFLLLRWTKRE